jgi:hypothetical protein
MQLNSYPLVDRYNRPGVNSPVAIRTQFINNGQLFDPYDVSACTIFNKYANTSPSSVLDSATQIIKTGLPVSPASQLGVLMNFEISGGGDADIHDGDDGRVTSERLTDEDWFPEYTPGNQASGIFRIKEGDYVCVLDGTRDLEGGFNLNYGFEKGPGVENGASSVAEYIDVWTVRLNAASEYQTFINSFSLYNDTFLALTEELLLTASNKLHTKYINLGPNSVTKDLVITTDLTIQNKNLTDEVKNIIQDYGIQNPEIDIWYIDNGRAVPSSTVVDTENEDIRVTGDNTIVYPLTLDSTAARGTYIVQVYYEFLTQKLQSQPMYFVVD